MSKFTVRCSDAVALARTNFFSYAQSVQLGCGTHDIERVLSSVARAPLCRLMACCRFTSARTRIRWCFTCLVCVSVTATRPCTPRTRHHCGHRHHCVHRRRRGAYLRLTTRTDSRNHVYSFGNPYSGTMYASTFMRPCTVDSELCSCARCGEFTMGRKMLQT